MYWLAVILIVPYLIILLRFCRSLWKVKPFTINNNPSVFVSVVIACRNEEKNLPFLLEDLQAQNYLLNRFEVIFVDDNSTDNTAGIISSFAGPGNIRVISSRGQGKKQALRTGIMSAKGELILTTDADCRAGKDWIRTVVAFYEEKHPDMIILPVRIESGKGPFHSFQELEFLSLQGVTAGSALSGSATMCNGANLAFSRDIFLLNKDKLHDEINSGDDIFLLQSLKMDPKAKIMWLESPKAMISTSASLTLSSFLKQRKRWISKAGTYRDADTIVLGISTFIASMLLISALIAVAIDYKFIWFFLLIYVLKSIPDFLILWNTTARYGATKLLRCFIPLSLLYPFYVFAVFLSALTKGKTSKISSPFQKGT
jgi:poly-beta-1,6-N-acetyl-D-glucosamine synthase